MVAQKPPANTTVRKPRAKVAPKLLSVTEAAKSGSRRRLLEALRDKLARDIEVAGPGVVAQIASQLRATVEELDQLPVEVGSVIDEITARRKNRKSTTESLDGTRGG